MVLRRLYGGLSLLKGLFTPPPGITGINSRPGGADRR